ncbi:glycosyltransferase [Pelagibacteraceae bacterium]|jgi:glycosyltransferase involved in cell wall biosynthesis|nr:glycosyltransferase [Pelagibacteraceae bacterium]MDC1158112.1 glycosyltransferase [Pelagibacteraceae bacterium]
MKNKKPLISVIMNCYNGEKYLKKSINSIINQSYKNWELIFWDNKSTDDSKKILLNYNDKRIKYYKSKNFVNLYEARNLAISKSKGKFICFLDVDDWWIRKKLEIQVNFINNNKKVNFLYSNLFIYNEKKRTKYLYINHKIPNGKITQILLNKYRIGILTVIINRKLFKNKKFNKSFNIIGDFDFFISLSVKENFFYLDEPLAYYREHIRNYSKKINIYAEELKRWININSLKMTRLNLSLTKIKIQYFKLKLKKSINFF